MLAGAARPFAAPALQTIGGRLQQLRKSYMINRRKNRYKKKRDVEAIPQRVHLAAWLDASGRIA